LSGARAARVIEQPNSTIDEHAHDWPVLSLYVMGSCARVFDGVVTAINGPCAVLHPPGAFHSSSIGPAGLEQIDIEFDPAWLRLSDTRALQRVQHWSGGRMSDAVRRLSACWTRAADDGVALEEATGAFIERAITSAPARQPRWLRTVLDKLDQVPPLTTSELARELDLHPAWLNQAYRSAVGEGLHQSVARKRIERAALLLRNSGDPAAQIAAETGFCDQSHMIRCFRQLLGRTPNQVRSEAAQREAYGSGLASTGACAATEARALCRTVPPQFGS
jgi:AraC family transcriptional regulator